MSLPNTFKASVVPSIDAKSIIIERSLPPLEPGEVAIKVHSTAINPIDWKMRDWHLFIASYPAILGSDASGTIAALAPDVTNFAVGERVFFQGVIANYDASTFQQYLKLPAWVVGKTPKNVSDDEAAGVSLATIAALTAFYDSTGYGLTPPPWEPHGNFAAINKAVAIIGGSTSVGQYAIQLARLSGFPRIVTNASLAHHEHLKSLGATVVLDRATQSTPEAFAAAVGGTPLAVVLDAISNNDTHLLATLTSQASSQITSSPPAVVVRLNLEPLHPTVLHQSQQEPRVEIKQIVGMGSLPTLRHITEPGMKWLGKVLASGEFKPNAVELVEGGLGGIEEALERNKRGVSGVKVVVRPFE